MAQEVEDNIEEEEAPQGAEFNEDVFSSMLDGSFEPESVEEEDDVEDDIDEDDIEDDEENEDDIDEDEHEEDTDLEDDDLDEDDLDDPIDGDGDEESDSDEDDEEEDTLVDDDDLDDEDDEEEDSDDEDADAEDDESEDDAETDGTNDGEAQETDGVDYKAFYDAVVNTEFTVNGKKSKGFSDPKKIIQSMQMAGGFSEKMAGFKQYRPYMAPLKERGMLDDPKKFDLAMNILDGDKEAIKQHLSTLNIDPLDLDMEAIAYAGKATTASEASLAVDDAIDRAKVGGYEDRFRQVIGSEWDKDSFNEFVDNPKVRADLLDHMESGAYEKVTDRMSEISRLDHNGTFSNMSTIEQYRAAVQQLQAEQPTAQEAIPVVPPTVPAVQKPVVKKTSVSAEKAKIKKARQEAAYKKEVTAKNAKVAKQRKRATSMSKKKPKAKATPKFDPMDLQGSEVSDHLDFLINGGR